MIDLPIDTVSQITGNASDLISDLSGIWTLILGVLLAVVVIGFIIKVMK